MNTKQGLPEYGFHCPECHEISTALVWARIERFDSVHVWDPGKRDMVEVVDSEDETEGGSGWRCPKCDAEIKNVEDCLVKLTFTAVPICPNGEPLDQTQPKTR